MLSQGTRWFKVIGFVAEGMLKIVDRRLTARHFRRWEKKKEDEAGGEQRQNLVILPKAAVGVASNSTRLRSPIAGDVYSASDPKSLIDRYSIATMCQSSPQISSP